MAFLKAPESPKENVCSICYIILNLCCVIIYHLFINDSDCQNNFRQCTSYLTIVLIKGGVQPHFSPRHTKIWIWGWAKMGKKVYVKTGKQTFYFQNRKNPHFSP